MPEFVKYTKLMKKNYYSKNVVVKELQRMFRDKYVEERLKLSLLKVDGEKILRWTYIDEDDKHYVVFDFKGNRGRLFVLRSSQAEEAFIKEMELPDDFDVIFCTECDGITKVKRCRDGDIRIKKLNIIKSWYLRNF